MLLATGCDRVVNGIEEDEDFERSYTQTIEREYTNEFERALIDSAKSNPGKITYASAGNGSLSHMLGELFKSSTATDLLHVPYKGVGPALNDTLGGQVNILFDNLPSSLPHIQSGKLRALAVGGAAALCCVVVYPVGPLRPTERAITSLLFVAVRRF
jgi:hypothetical protein